MALKLFQITDTKTKKAVPGSFFANKRQAKALREKLNAGEDGLRYVVSPGPDHHKYRA